jgi:hypothetical protein
MKAYRFFAMGIIRVNRVHGVVNTVDGHDRLVDKGLAGFIERIKGRMAERSSKREQPSNGKRGLWFKSRCSSAVASNPFFPLAAPAVMNPQLDYSHALEIKLSTLTAFRT